MDPELMAFNFNHGVAVVIISAKKHPSFFQSFSTWKRIEHSTISQPRSFQKNVHITHYLSHCSFKSLLFLRPFLLLWKAKS